MVIILVALVAVLVPLMLIQLMWQEFVPGGFSLDGIYLDAYPGVFYFRTEDDPEIDDALREELVNSSIALVFEIAGSNFSQEIPFTYRKGYDQLSLNRTAYEATGKRTSFVTWEYDVTYEYSIRIVCHTSNETVRTFSIFDEDRHICGSFRITRSGDSDVVEWTTAQGVLLTEGGSPRYVYIGTPEDAAERNIFAFSVKLQEYGVIP